MWSMANSLNHSLTRTTNITKSLFGEINELISLNSGFHVKTVNSLEIDYKKDK